MRSVLVHYCVDVSIFFLIEKCSGFSSRYSSSIQTRHEISGSIRATQETGKNDRESVVLFFLFL